MSKPILILTAGSRGTVSKISQQIHRLGSGPKPIHQKHLCVERLRQASLEATSNPRMRRSAESIGKKIRAENGVAQAVEIVKQYI